LLGAVYIFSNKLDSKKKCDQLKISVKAYPAKPNIKSGKQNL